MSYYLYLDDVREPKHFDSFGGTWTVIRSYQDFVNKIDNDGIPDAVSYDHDLGEDKTGYDCAKYLIEKCLELNRYHPPYCVHSANPVGRENIEKYIKNYNEQRLSK